MEADAEFIEENLEYYSETQGLLPENLEQYGEKYKDQGFLTREQLYEIAFESSTRSAYHVRKNPEKRCKDISSNILKVEDDFSKIALISSLKGFKAPTGSCVLAAVNPEEHAVVDTRVWASLERLGYFEDRKESFDPDDYVKMINPIREIADKTGFRAVDVGYALFAYDDKVREDNLH